MDSHKSEWKNTQPELDMLRKDWRLSLQYSTVQAFIPAQLHNNSQLRFFFSVHAYINISYKHSLTHTHYVQPLFLSISIVKCVQLPGGMLDSCPKPLAFLSLCICVCGTVLAFCGFLWACSIFEPVCVCGPGHVTGLSLGEECLCGLQTADVSL